MAHETHERTRMVVCPPSSVLRPLNFAGSAFQGFGVGFPGLGIQSSVLRPLGSVHRHLSSNLRSPQAGGESPGVRGKSRDINFRSRIPLPFLSSLRLGSSVSIPVKKDKMYCRNIILAVLALAFSVHVSATELSSEEKARNFREAMRATEKIQFEEFAEIKRFYGLTVMLMGTAEKIGINEAELTEFMLLKFRNNFAGYEIASRAPLVEAQRDWNAFSKTRKEWANIMISIQTAGSDYPVAYYIELKMSQLSGSKDFERSVLGYSSAEQLRTGRTIKDTIATLMEEAATLLLLVNE